MTRARVPAQRASESATPALPPLYGSPPYAYLDAWSLLIVFHTDPRVLRRIVPRPLVADPTGTMSLTVSRFFTCGFGSYHEMVLAAVAKLEGRPVNYCVQLVLDNDIALGAGREIWGFPKKLGTVTLSEHGGVVRATVDRAGGRLVDAAMAVGALGGPRDLNGSLEYVNLKLIPSVEQDRPPEVMQLTSTTLENFVLHKLVVGRGATVQFHPSPADPFHTIPVREVAGGWYYNADFDLGYGTVVHDYLAR